MTQLPPCDLDAEATVISACVLSQTALAEVMTLVAPEDFFADANRRIYEAILWVDEHQGKVDAVLIAGRLRETKRLDQVGGVQYLARVIDGSPAVINVVEHAKTVAEKARLRRVIETCRRFAAEGYGDVGNVADWCNNAVGELARVTDSMAQDDTLVSAKVAAEATMDELRNARQNGGPGIKTGFPTLDRRTGGLRRGVQYCVAGRPGHGKTALALCIATNVAASGLGVVFVSCEMPTKQLVVRAIAQRANLDSADLESGNMNSQAWSDAAKAAKWFGELPIQIDDRPAQTKAGIRAAVRRGTSRLRNDFGHALEIGLVVVDYIQILNGERQKGESREQEVSGLSKSLMWMAKELRVPVLTLSQLNRGDTRTPKKAKDYKLSDLRESGAIEQDNFGVFFVHRDDQDELDKSQHNGQAQLIIAKLRQGGSCGILDMMFHGPSTRFYEKASEYDDIADDFVDQMERQFP